MLSSCGFLKLQACIFKYVDLKQAHVCTSNSTRESSGFYDNFNTMFQGGSAAQKVIGATKH